MQRYNESACSWPVQGVARKLQQVARQIGRRHQVRMLLQCCLLHGDGITSYLAKNRSPNRNGRSLCFSKFWPTISIDAEAVHRSSSLSVALFIFVQPISLYSKGRKEESLSQTEVWCSTTSSLVSGQVWDQKPRQPERGCVEHHLRLEGIQEMGRYLYYI